MQIYIQASFPTMDDEDETLRADEVFGPLEKLDIYLPRADDREPRYPRAVLDHLFTAKHIYKFSDQILQDRPLFSSRRDISRSFFSTNTDSNEDNESLTARSSTSDDKEKVGRVSATKLITLKLESIATYPRTSGPRRFNEPLNSYVANRKRLNLVKNSRRAMLRNDTYVVPYPLQNDREGASNRSSIRTLGLPPIQEGHDHRADGTWSRISLVRSQTTIPSYSQMPARLSWKPHAIWKQPADVSTIRDSASVHSVKSEFDRYIRREFTVF